MEEQDDIEDFILFDVSDVTWEPKITKDGRKFYLIGQSEDRFNLMRVYLALKEYLFQIEQEIGVMDEPPEMQ